MNSEDKPLPRASSIIPEDGFKKLFYLSNKHPWLQDENEALLALWNSCKFATEQDLVYDLLDRFNYLTSKDLKDCGIKIACHIQEVWQLKADSTRIVAVADKGTVDGSQMFLQSLKNKFSESDWSEYDFINTIPMAFKAVQENFNVVLVDDFIGSGSTIEKRVNWFFETMAKAGKNNISIWVIALAAQVDGEAVLKDLRDKGAIVNYYVPLTFKKGITGFYTGDKLSEAERNMRNLEDQLAPTDGWKHLPHFGYKRSEALFAVQAFNTPNNVFPIFWWSLLKNKNRRKTILQRI